MLDPTRDQGTPSTDSLRLIDVSISYHPAAFGLTARGDAALTLQRLKRQLLTLDAEDRAWVASDLRAVAEEGCEPEEDDGR